MAATTIEEPLQDDLASERPATARRILIEAAFLGLLADGALRNAPAGLGWTLWVLALSLAALNVARHRGLSITGEQLAWLGTAVACSASFAWRDAEALRAASVLGTLVALTMFAMCVAGVPALSVFAARVRDVIAAGVYTVRDLAVGAPVLAVVDAELHKLSSVRRGASWTAVRALLLALPLVLVFGLLLSRADPILARVFRIPPFDAEVVIEHVMLTGVFAWWTAGFLRGAILGVTWRPVLPDRLPFQLGVVEITTALGALVALFGVFVVLQLRWLFGGADLVLATTGLTVAEYARRGFFELVTVAALVVPVILVSRALIEEEAVIHRHRRLSLALIVLLAPMMASALLRMKLYVDHFGLTTDRLYATALMAWLGIVFIAMARTVFRGWARPFAAMSMLSGFVMLFILNAVNPDQWVARVNLGRPSTERGVDYEYLARLSGDAMPTVVRALVVAAPSLSSCTAARSLRDRALRQPVPWNLGAVRGRQAITSQLTDAALERLCAGIPAPQPKGVTR